MTAITHRTAEVIPEGTAIGIVITDWDRIIVFRRDGYWRAKIGQMVPASGGIGGSAFHVHCDVLIAADTVPRTEALTAVLTGAVASDYTVSDLGDGFLVDVMPDA